MEQTARHALTANLPALSDSDQRFAASLLSARHPSSKQISWIDRLAARAVEAAAKASEPAEQVGNVQGIVTLINRGGLRLKHPAILFHAEGQTLRLSIAGERSRAPGSVTVTSPDRGFSNRVYYGRITPSGEWEATPRDTGITSTAILAALRAFAENPAKVAAEYGRTTGACCFCARDLTDERSVSVGYGPICADRYCLPWGHAIEMHAEAA